MRRRRPRRSSPGRRRRARARGGRRGGVPSAVAASGPPYMMVRVVPDARTPGSGSPSLGALRAGEEVELVAACTRKERLVARSGTPYLALELRDRSGSMPARVFRDADVLAGRFERGDLVRVRGRVERFREELQLDVGAIERAPDADPADFLPV